jgi:hypothetical protein
MYQLVCFQLGDVISGAGLFVVLALCSSNLEDWVKTACVCAGFVVALVTRTRVGLFFQTANLVFNLVVTLSVCLNLFAHLCPREGKELALCPVYVLLCLSRPTLTPLSGVVLGLITLSFVGAFLVALGADTTVVDSPLSITLSTSDSTALECLSLFVVSVYGSLSQMMPEYSPHDDTRAPFKLVLAGGACRLILFAAVGMGKSALLSLFLAPTQREMYPHPPNYLSALYGICLLVTCMHMASAWFEKLKAITALLSGRAYAARRLVRLQHILNAGILGAAWAFPLYLSELRTLITGGLLVQIF